MAAASDICASCVKELPALPQVVTDLIVAMDRDDLSIDEFADKLARDQALAAKTLRLANSSFYGMPRQVEAIHDAVSVLGMRTVRSVVLAASVTSAFRQDQCPGFAFNDFWRHSMGTALCAKALARHADLNGEVAFTIGLIHDIGRLALIVCAGKQFAQVLKHRDDLDGPLLESERAVLGTDHCAIGRQIAEHWRFTPQIADAVASHHEPPDSPEPTMAGLVHVADNIVHALDLNHAPDELVPPLSLHAWSALRLTEPACRDIFDGVETQLQELCRTLLS
ncbi:HDOD domain-containing protein [Aquabacterium sp.]|uniref:HDOD domain-containing protein n=1 Tax=Aquabacterium sp. TaxID=1872578 RepID=UPI0035AF3859